MTNVNPNTHFPHGDDPSVSDATGPVVITEGEQAALSNTSMEKEDKTPRTEMGDSDIHTSQGVDVLPSEVASPVANQAGEDTFQPQAKTNAPAKVGRNEPCPCGSGKKFKKCCGRGQERTGMTHEFLVIYDRKRRIAGHLLPDPTPSVEWIWNQAIDFCTRFPDYSGVMVLKVKYNLDSRNVLRVWAFDPATETWLDVNDASAIRWVQNVFNANQQTALRQVLDAFPRPVTAVQEGTPGENGKIEVKTISQEECGQARRSIEVFVFLVKDKAGTSFVICHARSLDDAMSIFIPHHTFILHRPKAGLKAGILKVKLDLNSRRVLDANLVGVYKVNQVEPNDAELSAFQIPPGPAAEENRKLATGMMQEFFQSQQTLFDLLQDPQTEVASSPPMEFDPTQGTNPMVVEMFHFRDKNGQNVIGYDPEQIMADFSKTSTPKEDNFLLSQKVKFDLRSRKVLSVQPYNPITGELGSPQVPIAELQEELQEAIDKVLPTVLKGPIACVSSGLESPRERAA